MLLYVVQLVGRRHLSIRCGSHAGGQEAKLFISVVQLLPPWGDCGSGRFADNIDSYTQNLSSLIVARVDNQHIFVLKPTHLDNEPCFWCHRRIKSRSKPGRIRNKTRTLTSESQPGNSKCVKRYFLNICPTLAVKTRGRRWSKQSVDFKGEHFSVCQEWVSWRFFFRLL